MHAMRDVAQGFQGSTDHSSSSFQTSNNGDDHSSGFAGEKPDVSWLSETTSGFSADTINTAEAEHARSEAQRRRHRENMSRYRHKKKATLGEMKMQEQVLAAQLESMLQLHASQSKTYRDRYLDEDGDDADARASGRRSPTAMDEFVHVLTEKDQLEHANASLRQRVLQHRNFQALAQDTCNEQLESTSNTQRDQDIILPTSVANKPKGSEKPGSWVKFIEDEAPFFYVQLTTAQCLGMVEQTLQQVYAFQTLGMTPHHASNVRVARLFDWTASLQTEWGEDTQVRVMRYQFFKTFRNPARTIDEAVDAEWAVLHDPQLYQKLHSVPVQTKVLQKVNDDVSVIMLNSPHPSQSLRYRSVSIIARTEYQDPRGRVGKLVTMAKQQLDLGTQVTSLGEEVMYTSNGFLATAFMPGDNADHHEIHVEYSGLVPVVNEDQAQFLMVGIGSSLVRLEMLLFPFRVLTDS